MRKSYRVVYAGIPSSQRVLSASSTRDAAMAFFASRPLQNSVIVHSGLLKEEVFGWQDFASDVPELRNAQLPFESEKLPPYDPARDPIVRLFRAGIIVAGFVLLAIAVMAAASGVFPGIAVVFLVLAGIMTLLVGRLRGARTLRRFISRDPNSLDSR